MHAQNLSLEYDKKKAAGGVGSFATDTQISGAGAVGERQLQKFTDFTDLKMTGLESSSGDNSSWDQFAGLRCLCCTLELFASHVSVFI